jgi:hypothetical protein
MGYARICGALTSRVGQPVRFGRNTSRNTPPSKWDEEAACVENGH